MDKSFDRAKAKDFLESLESGQKETVELERKVILSAVVDGLKKLFSSSGVEVYLVGSITQPYMFHAHSDVDIVLKNFIDDRFDVWTKMETMIKRNVEIIIFENCHFQEHVITNGLKVL